MSNEVKKVYFRNKTAYNFWLTILIVIEIFNYLSETYAACMCNVGGIIILMFWDFKRDFEVAHHFEKPNTLIGPFNKNK